MGVDIDAPGMKANGGAEQNFTTLTQFRVNIKEDVDGNYGVQLIVICPPAVGLEINLSSGDAKSIGHAMIKAADQAAKQIIKPRARIVSGS